MIPNSKTKFNELIEGLNALAWASPVDAFSLRRIERDAEALKVVDPSGAFTVLGAVACLRKDFEAMKFFHTRAIELNGGSAALFQFATSLSKAGLFSEALNVSEEACALDPTNADGIERTIGRCLSLGLRSRARAYAAKWRALNPNSEPFITDEEIENHQGEVRLEVDAIMNSLLVERGELWAALSTL